VSLPRLDLPADLTGVIRKPILVRKPMIGANWKMHKDPAGTGTFFEAFRPLVEFSTHCEIVICPSFLDVAAAVAATRGTRIHIGAQDLYWEAEGAFTGEVSGPMVRASGCSHVIVGHSERRRYFGETNESVLRKTVAALDAGLTPIVCIGESEKKNVSSVLAEQFRCAIGLLSGMQFDSIVIAYEPIWAIGAGETATPEVAAHAHRLIRAQAREHFGARAADNIRILYGGSVKPDNAESLIAEPEIDGFLVGGASLDASSFAALANLKWDHREKCRVDKAPPRTPAGSIDRPIAEAAQTVTAGKP
jgi:triosephosphate isomerase